MHRERIQLQKETPMSPQCGRLTYNYNDPLWITSASLNPPSNRPGGRRHQNQTELLDWTIEIREVSILLNLETEEISIDGIKLTCDVGKRECQNTALAKATKVLKPHVHCQVFDLIRSDAFMVKYQE